MAFQVLRNCKLYFAGHDVSGDMNKLDLKYSAETLDKTVFGATTKSRLMGLKDVELSGGGFWEADSAAFKIDDVVNSKLAVADELITVCPTDGAAGEVAFFFPALLAEYSPGAAVGEIFAFEISASGCQVLGRGTIMETGAKSATAGGTARQLGAVSASQKVYAGLHILAASGTNPTLDLKIQSDDAQGMASPTDRITFAQATGIGSQWATPVAGAITDNWWRAYWTLGGTTPSFTVVVVVAIQ